MYNSSCYLETSSNLLSICCPISFLNGSSHSGVAPFSIDGSSSKSRVENHRAKKKNNIRGTRPKAKRDCIGCIWLSFICESGVLANMRTSLSIPFEVWFKKNREVAHEWMANLEYFEDLHIIFRIVKDERLSFDFMVRFMAEQVVYLVDDLLWCYLLLPKNLQSFYAKSCQFQWDCQLQVVSTTIKLML